MKKLKYILFIILSFMVFTNVHAETSFQCIYNVTGDSLNKSLSGTLTCKFGYKEGIIFGGYTIDCEWESSGSKTWVNEMDAANFNLKEHLKSGNTTCPTYTVVQTSDHYHYQVVTTTGTGTYTDGINAYFTNDLQVAQDKVSEMKTYYAIGTDTSQPNNEFTNQMCNAKPVSWYEEQFERIDENIDKFYENKCDLFELSEEEKETVPLASSIKKHRDCSNYLESTESLNNMLNDLEEEYNDYHCFDSEQYTSLKNSVKDRKSEIEVLSNQLDSAYNEKIEQTDPNDPSKEQSPNENEDEKEPDYKVDDSINVSNICSKPEFRKPAKIVGVVVTLMKILVPIVVILFGAIDFYKAVFSQKDDGVKKAAKAIAIRAAAGVAVFLLPGIVQMVLNMVNEWSGYKNNWCCCTECILNSNCDVNSCSSESCHIEGTN